MKRALADAPCGARLKALFSFIKLAGFSLKQCLDARASIQIVTGQRLLTGESIITRQQLDRNLSGNRSELKFATDSGLAI